MGRHVSVVRVDGAAGDGDGITIAVPRGSGASEARLGAAHQDAQPAAHIVRAAFFLGGFGISVKYKRRRHKLVPHAFEPCKGISNSLMRLPGCCTPSNAKVYGGPCPRGRRAYSTVVGVCQLPITKRSELKDEFVGLPLGWLTF